MRTAHDRSRRRPATLWRDCYRHRPDPRALPRPAPAAGRHSSSRGDRGRRRVAQARGDRRPGPVAGQLVDTVLVRRRARRGHEVDVAAGRGDRPSTRARPTAACQHQCRRRRRRQGLGPPGGAEPRPGLRRWTTPSAPPATEDTSTSGVYADAQRRAPGQCSDDGPGLGKVASRTSLGLTTTRAMVAACNGSFRLRSAERRWRQSPTSACGGRQDAGSRVGCVMRIVVCDDHSSCSRRSVSPSPSTATRSVALVATPRRGGRAPCASTSRTCACWT